MKRGRWLSPLRVALAVVQKLLSMATGIYIASRADIGPGLFIPHAGPIRIHPATKIGADCAIHQVVTIGATDDDAAPVIGDHVMIGCHCVILGGITVGERVKVGAGAVVTKNVPANATVVGQNSVHAAAA
jgi:serine O-acetyltransferase